VVQVARSIFRDEGPSALFAGGLERVMRSSPQFAVTLALFDVLKAAAAQNGMLGS
jgi:solute carrier family 25 aspartate/glutamate transporter 12/13